jgi:hypothetical protein
LDGKQHLYYSKLHRKYGDVVRIGPNELSIRDVDSIAPLMSPNGFHKGPFWSGRIPSTEKVTIPDNGVEEHHVAVRSLIAIVDKQEHARRKRPWSRGLSTAALKGYESLVIKRNLQFVDVLLSKNLKEAVNLASCITYLGYDVMTDIAFGGGSERMRDGDVMGLLHALDRAQTVGIFLGHVPWLGAMVLSYPDSIPDYRKVRADGHARAMRRIKEGSTSKDLFHHLIDEDNVGANKPSVSEVISDSMYTTSMKTCRKVDQIFRRPCYSSRIRYDV